MNEYQKKYEDLINFRKNIQPFNRWNKLYKFQQEVNLPPAYGEYHHIQPKCLRPDLAKDPDNIVCLTAYEHVLAHKYLVLWFKEEYGENSNEYIKMWLAYEKTIQGQGDKLRISDEEAASLKIEKARVRNLYCSRKMTPEEVQKLKRTTTTPEAIAKKKASLKKYFNTPGVRKMISKQRKETAAKPEVKAKRSAAQKIAQNRPETKAKMSVSIRKAYKRPEMRKHVAEANKRNLSKPEVREKISVSVRKAYENPEVHEKISESLRKHFATPEAKNEIAFRSIQEIYQKDDRQVCFSDYSFQSMM